MTEIFIVIGDCGDYYCDGDHLIAAATTKRRAEELAKEAAEIKRGRGGIYGTFSDITVDGPITLDALNLAEFR